MNDKRDNRDKLANPAKQLYHVREWRRRIQLHNKDQLAKQQ